MKVVIGFFFCIALVFTYGALKSARTPPDFDLYYGLTIALGVCLGVVLSYRPKARSETTPRTEAQTPTAR